jgi:hypothetical protein
LEELYDALDSDEPRELVNYNRCEVAKQDAEVEVMRGYRACVSLKAGKAFIT